jgi:hypothetical protein
MAVASARAINFFIEILLDPGSHEKRVAMRNPNGRIRLTVQ